VLLLTYYQVWGRLKKGRLKMDNEMKIKIIKETLDMRIEEYEEDFHKREKYGDIHGGDYCLRFLDDLKELKRIISEGD
jgi:hypothetical protein